MINKDNIPKDLRNKNIWCVNVNKVPYRPYLKYGHILKAKANDSTTWGGLDTAIELLGNVYEEKTYNQETKKFDVVKKRKVSGLSIFITEPHTFIDLDHVINNKGDLLPSAKEIIEQLKSYTEVSFSGTGIHILTSGKYDLKLDNNKHKGINLPIDTWEQTEDKPPSMEIYQSKRSMTFTTNVYNNMNSLNDDISPLKWLEDKYLKGNINTTSDKPIEFKAYTEFDAEIIAESNNIIHKLMDSKKFTKLYIDGDNTDYGSGSEGDIALCGIIANHTKDTRVIDCIFMMSELYTSGERKEKWDRLDYKKSTIEKVLNRTELIKNSKGVPLHTKENTLKILEMLDYDVGYDVLLNDVCITNINQVHDMGYYINKIYSYCRSIGFSIKKSDLEEYIFYIARDKPYNPFREYLLNCKVNKGGTGELNKLLNTVEYDIPICEVEEYTNIKNLYDSMIQKALISIVAINIEGDLLKRESKAIEGTLILKGAQGIGKTTWLRNLVPDKYFKEGAVLNDKKDTKLETYKYILVELGELETTTRKEATGFLKNELTRRSVEYRVPYAKAPIKFARHTIFCGSVNEDTFLKDSTGNRRFWVIPVKSIDLDAEININNLWAEIIGNYEMGINWFLSEEERKLLEELNKSYVDVNYIGMVLESTFDFNESDESKWIYARTEAVIQLISEKLSKNTNKSMVVGQLRQLGCKETGIRIVKGDRKQTKVWHIPPLKNKYYNLSQFDIWKKTGDFYNKIPENLI